MDDIFSTTAKIFKTRKLRVERRLTPKIVRLYGNLILELLGLVNSHAIEKRRNLDFGERGRVRIIAIDILIVRF